MQKALILAALMGASLAAQPARALPAGPLDFTVLRDGSKVGTHLIDVRKNGEQTKVDIETDVAVKLAFITVYRFEHEGHEVWRDGHLVQIRSKTDDDGTGKSLRGALHGDSLEIDGSAQHFVANPEIVPASLWNPAIVQQNRLLNTLDGSEMEIHVQYVGEEPVEVRGKQVPARHYAITGQLQRELWFDGDGTLVQVRFKASDDSDIRYVLN